MRNSVVDQSDSQNQSRKGIRMNWFLKISKWIKASTPRISLLSHFKARIRASDKFLASLGYNTWIAWVYRLRIWNCTWFTILSSDTCQSCSRFVQFFNRCEPRWPTYFRRFLGANCECIGSFRAWKYATVCSRSEFSLGTDIKPEYRSADENMDCNTTWCQRSCHNFTLRTVSKISKMMW